MVYVRLLMVLPITLGAWSMALVLWQPPEYYYNPQYTFLIMDNMWQKFQESIMQLPDNRSENLVTSTVVVI